MPEALLDRRAPLLDVLRRRMRINRGEAHSASVPKHRRAEVHGSSGSVLRWREVVALLRLRKDVRNVMPLVAPRIHIHRREEDAERAVKNQPCWEALFEIPNRGAKLCWIRILQPLGETLSARQ